MWRVSLRHWAVAGARTIKLRKHPLALADHRAFKRGDCTKRATGDSGSSAARAKSTVLRRTPPSCCALAAIGQAAAAPPRRVMKSRRRVSANVGGIGCGPAGVDPHVAAEGPAQERQPLQECPDPDLKFRIIRACGQKHANAPHPLGLLRPRRPRPCRRAAEEGYEFAPSHGFGS
jgi:hypothetical protein